MASQIRFRLNNRLHVDVEDEEFGIPIVLLLAFELNQKIRPSRSNSKLYPQLKCQRLFRREFQIHPFFVIEINQLQSGVIARNTASWNDCCVRHRRRHQSVANWPYPKKKKPKINKQKISFFLGRQCHNHPFTITNDDDVDDQGTRPIIILLKWTTRSSVLNPRNASIVSIIGRTKPTVTVSTCFHIFYSKRRYTSDSPVSKDQIYHPNLVSLKKRNSEKIFIQMGLVYFIRFVFRVCANEL